MDKNVFIITFSQQLITIIWPPLLITRHSTDIDNAQMNDLITHWCPLLHHTIAITQMYKCEWNLQLNITK